nr:AraC family transcriptional regulator [uncultured Pseudomonas sp.]
MKAISANQPWRGELWLGTDFALFKGLTGHASPHQHYAHQCLSVLQAGEPGPWQWTESMQAHAVEVTDAEVLAVYAEPSSFDIASLHAIAAADYSSLAALAQTVQSIRRQPLPERLQAVLRQIDDHLLEKLSAAELASNVHTSVSHLQRLFDRQLGVSIRRMVLWRRLRLALRLAMQGSSLTEAAHAAGFADSAHLSRTLRSMFGISGRQTLRHLHLRLLPAHPPGGTAGVAPGACLPGA